MAFDCANCAMPWPDALTNWRRGKSYCPICIEQVQEQEKQDQELEGRESLQVSLERMRTYGQEITGVDSDGFISSIDGMAKEMISNAFLYLAYRLNKQMPGVILLSDEEKEGQAQLLDQLGLWSEEDIKGRADQVGLKLGKHFVDTFRKAMLKVEEEAE